MTNQDRLYVRLSLIDVETGEVIITDQPRLQGAESSNETKGWLLNWRRTYGRRTGHKVRLQVEPVQGHYDRQGSRHVWVPADPAALAAREEDALRRLQ